MSLKYSELNDVERRIVDGWIADGMSKKEAMRTLNADLEEAAEEDGEG